MWRARALVAALCAAATGASHASDFGLLSIGVRARVGEKRVLGEVQPESFRQYDLTTAIRTPWEMEFAPGWAAGVRVLASAGVLEGAGKTALVATLIPVLAIGTQDRRFTFDLGAGVALLSRHRYAQQDFGGPVQAALTVGISVPLYRRVGVGYRFLHYSDAGAYGEHTIGADFHMIELMYRF
jgi:hypothetical protein